MYRQGGYIAAPKKYLAIEQRAIELGKPINFLKDLKVSMTSREVVTLGSIISDKKFENKELIRDILLSQPDVDYLNISKSDFLNMEFCHIAFHGNGRKLVQKHLGVLWQETLEDYELFISDILGNYLFYQVFNSENGQAETEELFDELAQPMEQLNKESLEKEINRSLGTLTEREREVLSMFFGLTAYFTEWRNLSRKVIEDIHEKAKSEGREITETEIENIKQGERFINRITDCMENNEGFTLEEIGARFDLTCGRIRQIKEKAIRRLRHESRCKQLSYYLDYIPGWYMDQKARLEARLKWEA